MQDALPPRFSWGQSEPQRPESVPPDPPSPVEHSGEGETSEEERPDVTEEIAEKGEPGSTWPEHFVGGCWFEDEPTAITQQNLRPEVQVVPADGCMPGPRVISLG
jgi:hypothetical protein